MTKLLALQLVWGVWRNFDAARLQDGLLVGDQVAQRGNFNPDLVTGLLKCLLKPHSIIAIAAKLSSNAHALSGVCFGTVHQFNASQWL